MSMSMSINSGAVMINGTDSSGGRTIWVMNGTTLADGVSQQMVAEGSDTADATLAFLADRGQSVTANDVVTVLPDIEAAVSSRIGTIRDQTVQEAEAILSRRTQ